MLKAVNIKNYKSVKDSGSILFTERVFVLAGQNESGKSTILEALTAYEDEEFDKDTLNFEEEQQGNLRQEVSCTYVVEDADSFCNSLVDTLRDDFSINADEDFIDIGKLKQIKEYTITKTFNHSSEELLISLNAPVLMLIKAAVKNQEGVATNDAGEEVKARTPFVDVSNKSAEIASSVFSISPQIILFNTFSDLLPDKILISDLENKNAKAKGYNAVRNLEKLLSKDFVSISKLQIAHKSSATSIEVENLSTKFQQAWKQRIYDDGDLKIGFLVENDSIEGQATPTAFFSIETKDNVLLEPRKRSKGMVWFLSAWLDLKARQNGQSLVILYDEPGLYLHVKAHKDILNLFEELTAAGHQIIYSTHSPSLINTNILHNIGLVLNTKDTGTLVEGLTTSKINTKYKQDALQPIAEAMGLEPLKDFSVLSGRNVLVEGLSDFWYLQSMAKVLGKTQDYKFVPGIGIKGTHIYHLISFCVGYGLDWLLIMDNGVNSKQTRENLKKELFEDDELKVDEKIKLIPFSQIEDMFSIIDLNKVDSKVKVSDNRLASVIIGPRKIIFARDFASKVESKIITKKDLSKTTIGNFEEIFDWIEKQFNPSI
ncbi:AAA family ATPase [Patescibacteria group bacterium]|nr:AAA family ATPase [Patescibacteria group bacterium]